MAEFYIGKYLITNAQYAAFVQAMAILPEHGRSGHILPGKENHPVDNILVDDAVGLLRVAEQGNERVIRLPTEVEWEKAAGGTRRTGVSLGQ